MHYLPVILGLVHDLALDFRTCMGKGAADWRPAQRPGLNPIRQVRYDPR